MRVTAELYLMGVQDASFNKIECNLSALALDAYNVQKVAAQFTFVTITGADRSVLSAYPKLRVLDASGSALYTYEGNSPVSSYSYTIPSGSYAGAVAISLEIYSESALSTKLAELSLPISRENPIPFPRSETVWNSALIFRNGELMKIDDIVYMWTSPVPGNSAVDPKTDIQDNPLTTWWKSYQNWPLLASDIALFKFAKIASAVFMEEYQFSQQGKDANGQPTNDYSKFGTADFNPNLLLDFLRGTLKCNDVEVDGGIFKNVKSTNGSFSIDDNGDVVVKGKVTTAFNGKRITIDSANNEIVMYNESNNEVGRMSFYTVDGITLPRIKLSKYYGGQEIGSTEINAGNIFARDTISGVLYSLTLSPYGGLIFLRNGIETKKYNIV